jgi:hypothetical protein
MPESRYHHESGIVGWMASNPIAANLLLIIVLIAGLIAIQGIRKEVFPSFPSETFTVTVPYPGSSPEEVEQGIVLRIEEALRDIVGIKEIRSTASEGIGVVTVQKPGQGARGQYSLLSTRRGGTDSGGGYQPWFRHARQRVWESR